MSTTSPFPHLIDGVQNLPNLLTTYIISVIATYLTGVWGLNITSVAVMINLYSGIIGIMPLSLKFIVDAFNGNYWNVLLSRLAFSAGFVLLTLSTPPVLSWATSTCSTDEPECIGQVQKILFLIALLLIAVAVSCHLSRGLMTYELTSFFNEIMISPSDSDEPLTTSPESSDGAEVNKPAGFYSQSVVYMLVLILFVPFVSLAEIGYLNRWSLKFGFPAIFVVGLSILFIKIYQPQPRAAQGSLRATVFRKKDYRSFLFLIPASISFILLGVVSSLGNTFFIEQAVDMNHFVGSLWFPIITLPLIQHSCKMEGSINYSLPKLGIAFSMIFAILSCITAAKVETRRLGLVTSEGVTDEPEKIIPMTMFWLLPQFLLLGLSEAISEKSITDFFTNELILKPNDADEATRESNQKYMEFLAQALSGVGIVFGLLLVLIVRDVSAANGGTSWFGNTVNTSRLDNYYWTLATLSAANLVLFVVVSSSHHLCTKSRAVEREQSLSSTTLPLYAPNPVLVIIDVQPKELGIPTKAYYDVEEVKENATQKSKKVFVHVLSEIAAHEVEEIGVEHLLRDVKDTTISTLANEVTGKITALKGLDARLREIRSYLDLVIDEKLPLNHEILYHLQDVFNLLPNLNVAELVKGFAVKTNDMMLVIYLSSLIRSVIALHNLINNKMLNKEHEKAEDEKPATAPSAAASK